MSVEYVYFVLYVSEKDTTEWRLFDVRSSIVVTKIFVFNESECEYPVVCRLRDFYY